VDISGRPRTKQCAAQRVPASQAFILFGALSTSSWGASVGDSCLPRENSGPYVSYVTSEVFTLPAAGRPLIPVRWYALDKFGNRIPARAPVVLAYLDGRLRASGWRGGGMGDCCGNAYERGAAALTVTVTYVPGHSRHADTDAVMRGWGLSRTRDSCNNPCPAPRSFLVPYGARFRIEDRALSSGYVAEGA
jgi:hypothetical protein